MFFSNQSATLSFTKMNHFLSYSSNVAEQKNNLPAGAVSLERPASGDVEQQLLQEWRKSARQKYPDFNFATIRLKETLPTSPVSGQ